VLPWTGATPAEVGQVNIGQPKRIIEVEPESLPLPDPGLPMPETAPAVPETVPETVPGAVPEPLPEQIPAPDVVP